jgi:hypothetical protein
VPTPFPEPTDELGDRRKVLLTYLDFFRSTVADKVSGLSDEALRTSMLPSGWTPLELVKHLTFMERRWLVWGFLGHPVTSAWGDNGDDGRWHVAPGEQPAAVLEALEAGGRRTREIVSVVELSTHARAGGRFAADDPPPTLERILLHVLQEYARHLGHLDVVRELIDASVGE